MVADLPGVDDRRRPLGADNRLEHGDLHGRRFLGLHCRRGAGSHYEMGGGALPLLLGIPGPCLDRDCYALAPLHDWRADDAAPGHVRSASGGLSRGRYRDDACVLQQESGARRRDTSPERLPGMGRRTLLERVHVEQIREHGHRRRNEHNLIEKRKTPRKGRFP